VEVSNLLGNKYFTPQQYSLKHCIHNTNLAALSDRGERRSSRTVNESDFQSQRAQNTRNLDSKFDIVDTAVDPTKELNFSGHLIAIGNDLIRGRRFNNPSLNVSTNKGKLRPTIRSLGLSMDKRRSIMNNEKTEVNLPLPFIQGPNGIVNQNMSSLESPEVSHRGVRDSDELLLKLNPVLSNNQSQVIQPQVRKKTPYLKKSIGNETEYNNFGRNKIFNKLAPLENFKNVMGGNASMAFQNASMMKNTLTPLTRGSEPSQPILMPMVNGVGIGDVMVKGILSKSHHNKPRTFHDLPLIARFKT